MVNTVVTADLVAKTVSLGLISRGKFSVCHGVDGMRKFTVSIPLSKMAWDRRSDADWDAPSRIINRFAEAANKMGKILFNKRIRTLGIPPAPRDGLPFSIVKAHFVSTMTVWRDGAVNLHVWGHV